MKYKVNLKKFLPKTAKKGAPPGTIGYIGEELKASIKLKVIDYNIENIDEIEIENDILLVYVYLITKATYHDLY